MKKIASLFCRNYDTDGLVRNEVVPGSEWVTAGEGVATRKWDGTCCLVRDGKLFKRYDRKLTKAALRRPTNVRAAQGIPYTAADFKPAPDAWEAAEEAPNVHTGHWPGWLPVGDEPESKWHLAAWNGCMPDGTYELCGPHFNGNPEGYPFDVYTPHGNIRYPDFPRKFDAIKATLAEMAIEGVVWWHPDGRMVKIKTRDFGLPWPVKEPV